jgi:hypothetical protein
LVSTKRARTPARPSGPIPDMKVLVIQHVGARFGIGLVHALHVIGELSAL